MEAFLKKGILIFKTVLLKNTFQSEAARGPHKTRYNLLLHMQIEVVRTSPFAKNLDGFGTQVQKCII